MSRNINLPIRLQVDLIPAKWTLAQGFADRWTLTGKRFGVSVKIPALHGGLKRASHVVFSLDDLSPRWSSRLTQEKRRMLQRNYVAGIDDGRGEAIELLLCQPEQNNRTSGVRDLGSLREEFFDLKQQTCDLLDFLNRYGMWRLRFNPLGGSWRPVLSTRENPLGGVLQSNRNEIRQTVTPESIWRDGQRIRGWMQAGSKSLPDWFAPSETRLVLEPIGKFPFYAYTVRSIGDAIEASVGFDLLQGSQFALCARADCCRPFEVTRRAKQYCSYECAHLEVVRRSRRSGRRQKEQ